MKHVSEVGGAGWRDRIMALRDKASQGTFSCRFCRDIGIIHVRGVSSGAVGVVPCPECKLGGTKHIENNTCLWARGHRACPLCGAHEGEQVPAGYAPRLPAGFVTLEQLSSGELPEPADDGCPF